MQTQYALKQAGLTLPVTKLFQQHITTLLAEQSQQTSVRQWLLISVIRTTVQNPGISSG
jgi:ABC-type multidrug transport system fused ATPase/permease subunit